MRFWSALLEVISMMSKDDLLQYIRVIIDDFDETDCWDDKYPLNDNISDVAFYRWFFESFYEFAKNSCMTAAIDICNLWYDKMQEYYFTSASKEGEKLFMNAINETSSFTEMIWNIDFEEGEN